ncbi:MAG: rane dipeptidase [Gaiellaceae bacterium]|nr:rane dipeptidase [Gaiellaceae bacterium]
MIPVVDAHNDLLLELVLRDVEENPFAAVWLPQLRAGSVAVQICPVYAADAGDAARDVVDAQIAAFERAVRDNADDVVQIRSAADLDALGGRLGLMLSMEGVEALHGDPEAFDELWEAGVRMVSLTWNYPNPFAGGIESPEQGLTAAGRELVGSFAERGVVLDLAHASEPTYFDALDAASAAQVVVSHAGCRAVHDHVRNVSDDQLRALAERGGVLGVMALTLTVGRNGAGLERYLQHVDHAVQSMGIEHVALGSDFIDQVVQAELAAGKPLNASTQEALELGGGLLAIPELVGPADYPALLEALRRRGYDGERLEAIAHGNLLRVLRAALPPA